MNVSLLTKYNNYSYPARTPPRINAARRAQAAQLSETQRLTPDDGTAVHNEPHIGRYPSKQIKRVGFTALNGSWDQFMLSRFIELIERNTGGTLDAGAIMRKYDADGDGLLNADEQTAMIGGLTKAEFERPDASRSVTESIIEQLKALSAQEEPKYASGLLGAVRRYERLFYYENTELPEEAAVLAV